MNISNRSIGVRYSPFSAPFIGVIVTLQILIIIAAVLGNLLVCVAICISENLRNTAANYFIFSLAFSDLLTAIFSMPFDVEQTLKNWHWSHGESICSLWTTTYLIMVPTSILSLLAVSVDRYKAISDPLNKYKEARFMTRKRAAFVVLGLWLYSFLFALLPTMGLKLLPHNVTNNQCIFNTTVEYSLINSCLNFYVPLFIMCVIYFRVYKISSSMNQKFVEKSTHPNGNSSSYSKYSFPVPRKASKALPMKSTVSNDGQKKLICDKEDAYHRTKAMRRERERKKLKRNIKTAKSILLIVCTFFFCWIPHTTLSVVTLLCTRCFFLVPQEVYTLLLIMGYMNSALNPPLYSFHNPKFKEVFRTLFGLKKTCRTPNKNSTSLSLSVGARPKHSLTLTVRTMRKNADSSEAETGV